MSQVQAVQAQKSTAPAAKPGATPVPGMAEKYTAATTISSFDDLKTKAPDLYWATLKGIAQQMVFEIHHQQERLKKAMRGQSGG